MQYMRRTLLLAALIFGLPVCYGANAQVFDVDGERSTITYHGSHFLHGWTGTSSAVEGSVWIGDSDIQIRIQAPVKSFRSGNGNRDSDMLRVVEETKYPTVEFAATSVSGGGLSSDAKASSSSDSALESGGKTAGDSGAVTWQVTGDLSFHGRTHQMTVPVTIHTEEGGLRATASFPVQLTRYEIDRPKLMLMPISDEIMLEIDIRLTERAAADASG